MSNKVAVHLDFFSLKWNRNFKLLLQYPTMGFDCITQHVTDKQQQQQDEMMMMIIAVVGIIN